MGVCRILLGDEEDAGDHREAAPPPGHVPAVAIKEEGSDQWEAAPRTGHELANIARAACGPARPGLVEAAAAAFDVEGKPAEARQLARELANDLPDEALAAYHLTDLIEARRHQRLRGPISPRREADPDTETQEILLVVEFVCV